MLPDSGLLSFILNPNQGCRHITLIDPSKQTPEVAATRAVTAINAGSKMIFVGGSTDTPDEIVHSTCTSIQEAIELQIFSASQDPNADEENWQIPVILFPGGAHALSPAADGILFMMLMNSKTRKFLVGEQIKGAPHLHNFGVEAIPTGYLVFAPGGKVGEVGQAELIGNKDTNLVNSYALAAKMFGFKLLYLEAGSGANTQVSSECINAAKNVKELCLIVGGGIRTPEQAAEAAKAGANWIVTGTLTEETSTMNELTNKITDIVTAIQSSSS